ncbi:hypothetical protein CMI48_01525 [Candidatus Pacearchaeota archaeon]|nr:hypothetical protein [Candidatus Pacearchaeota archaeon]|tara:strand:- start:470 stop:721 length:252 start_codon:yes stop_codon:yes gene_type:complete
MTIVAIDHRETDAGNPERKYREIRKDIFVKEKEAQEMRLGERQIVSTVYRKLEEDKHRRTHFRAHKITRNEDLISKVSRELRR